MTYLVLVEPADAHRRDFARWCLSQDPPIMTASASGSEVPADLFATVPDALLEGALIDGHAFRPVAEGMAPLGDGYRPDPPGAEPPGPVKTSGARRPARKGTTR